MAPLDSSSGSVPAWRAALTEVHSAEQQLAVDPVALVEVAQQLRRAWGYLYRELHPRETVAAADKAVAELAERFHVPTFAGEQLARRLVFMDPASDEVAALCDAPELVTGLGLEAAVLRRAADEVAARRDGSAWVGLMLGGAVAVLLAFAPLIGDLGGTVTAPWRGHYFGNGKFEGEPRERFERSIELDFGKDSPMRGIGVDDFSIRWDTCLRIEEETKVRFELTSDDGSRLLVNGESVVDNWGDHGTETRGGSVTLPAGVHYVELEYYEARHGANVKLLATFDASKPATIPVEMLVAPGEGDEPCS
jgi:PA14 domain